MGSLKEEHVMINLFNGIFLVILGAVFALFALIFSKKAYQNWTKKILTKFKGKKIIAAAMTANFFG